MPAIEVTCGRLQAQAMAHRRSIEMAIRCRCEASRREISQIDQMLSEVGDFGEVHHKVKGGKLRLSANVESHDELNWEKRS